MTKMIKLITAPLYSLVILMGLTSIGNAETTVSAEVGFIFNTLLFLICGFLVMFMAAGFAMLESGMVTSKSVSVICAKNIGLFSIAGIMFWLVGYNLAYGIPEGGYIGTIIPWSDSSAIETGYSDGSDWYFQMVFCATTVSIVSGAMAERIKLWPFFLFAAILAGILYPIVMGWQWGGGWLAELGFSDFAGSTLVHSTGGAAALAGAIIIGPRLGRFTKSGAPAPIKPFAASSIPLVTVGVFILWLGWFGFNGGSQLAMGTAADAIAVSTIFINTFLAGAGGVMAAATVTRLGFGKTDVVQMLNGCIGGLVAITAEPLMPSPLAAILIGGVGGVIVVYGTKLLFALQIDDVVGAIPAHLFAGIWGTLIVPATNPDASFSAQLIGVLAVNIFIFVIAYIVWSIMKATVGLRLSKEAETKGTDVSETGVIAYAIRD
ncbi:MAG: ammonium transporter [Candidatus Pelagibacter bacterium]|jgi:Amt family ammonium transporter|nr:ammonium transporter [Candidatus Pelagibacter sp.]MDA8532921.1 ammonium transporter [Candidatus Pelagibacter bacterium]MDC1248042.1 ammonium transporter [Pelagibacteraceae bacterium]MDF1857902.1 ammonium transporter [Candidatus Pelagibacter bacterium]